MQQLKSTNAGQTIYQTVAEWIKTWSAETRGLSGYGSVGAVVGGTAGKQLAELRTALPGSWLLIPGYGTQGATADDIAAGFDESGLGAIVNNSRGILFPKSSNQDWEAAIATALCEMIEDLAKNTRAGRLR